MTQVYPESGNMGKILPEYLSKWTTEKVKSEGVSVITDSSVQGVQKTEDGKLSLSLNTGKEVCPFHLVKYCFFIFFSPMTRLVMDKPYKGGKQLYVAQPWQKNKMCNLV